MRTNVFLVTALCAVSLVTGCNFGHLSLPEQIKGKWVLVEANQNTVATDDAFIISFTSSNSARISSLLDSYDGPGDWVREIVADVTIEGMTVKVTANPENDLSVAMVMLVKSIYDDMMICDCQVSERIGDDVFRFDYPAVFIRDDVDFSRDIVGVWEGDELREDDSGLTDGVRCRFEFLQDGSYNYYRQGKDGSWQKTADEYSYFFCDGDLLFMRWKNAGIETVRKNTCWEIEIRGDAMRWKALRLREDGSSYVLRVDFKKVS